MLITSLTGGGPGDTVRGADGGAPRPAAVPPGDGAEAAGRRAADEGAGGEEEPDQRGPGGEDRPAGGRGRQPEEDRLRAAGRERPPRVQAPRDGRDTHQGQSCTLLLAQHSYRVCFHISH